MKKFFTIVLVFSLLAMSFAGCADGGKTAEVSAEEPEEEQSETMEEEMELPTVAVLLNGPISDMSWNTGGYNGMMAIEEMYGAEVSYVEKIAVSDMEDVFRAYAAQGYDIIFGHGAQFNDACLATAKDFPDTQFVMVNGTISKDNVVSVGINQKQQGYLMGAFAALMTDTETIGMIGGIAIPPILNCVEGFELGAAYVNADVEVISAVTGDNNDANKVKETAYSMIDRGADYIGSIAGTAGFGSIEACEENGIFAIGTGPKEYEVAPDTVIVSSLVEVPMLYTFMYDKIAEGTLEQKNYQLGAKEGAVHLTSFNQHKEIVPREVKEEIDKIIEAISNGEIIV
jgi:basic membrane protein A